MALPASKFLKNNTGMTSKLLHGSDLPPQAKFVDITVIRAREPGAEFNSRLILDIEPIFDGIKSWGVNQTNITKLASFVDDFDNLAGATIRLKKVKTPNPDGKDTWGLRVENVTWPKGRKPRT